MIKFRNLKANEVEVFPKIVKQNGCMVLLFKDARCDMNILDETVGPMNWQRKHKRENANCVVSIWDKEKEQWISKEDTGVESNTDKAKGLASDSFKRSCFNWGIGRELYTAPFMWIRLNKDETYKSGNKWKLDKSVKFKVDEFEVKDGHITKIIISDQNDKQRFSWNIDQPNKKPKTKSKSKKTTEDFVSKKQLNFIHKLIDDHKSDNDEIKARLYKAYNISSTKELTKSQASEVISKLKPKEE
jgi:hypothetical protein